MILSDDKQTFLNISSMQGYGNDEKAEEINGMHMYQKYIMAGKKRTQPSKLLLSKNNKDYRYTDSSSQEFTYFHQIIQ